jgi:hypothetical protein
MTTELPRTLFVEEDAGVTWRRASLTEANALLAGPHYLGCTHRATFVLGGFAGGRVVAAQVWAAPTSRHLPSDGSWLELSRWCLTPDAGEYAGSRLHRWAVAFLRAHAPTATTLVSYSDAEAGHTGALYRACNWYWAPTWHRLRTPPTGGGSWDGVKRQGAKDRWIFDLAPDPNRRTLLAVDDPPAIRGFRPTAKHEATWLARQTEVPL